MGRSTPNSLVESALIMEVVAFSPFEDRPPVTQRSPSGFTTQAKAKDLLLFWKFVRRFESNKRKIKSADRFSNAHQILGRNEGYWVIENYTIFYHDDKFLHLTSHNSAIYPHLVHKCDICPRKFPYPCNLRTLIKPLHISNSELQYPNSKTEIL